MSEEQTSTESSSAGNREIDENPQQNEGESPETETSAEPSEPSNSESSNSESSNSESSNDDLIQQAADAKDDLLRTQAEMQNIRRRAEQDVEKAHKFALNKFSADLLVVADNLERTLNVINKEDETQKPIVEGIELTLKSLLDTFAKYQIEAINPEGEPFDPQVHEAMSMVPNPDLEPNSVMAVMEKGYTLSGRLIRPARVIVSKEA